MGQLLVVLIVFLMIPLLSRFKINLSYILLTACTILALLSGIGSEASLKAISNTFTSFSSLNTILSVMMVGLLGGFMKHYKILDKLVETTYKILPNKKIILMVLPALMGTLIVPGGALLSAPFINEMGEEMKIPPPRRAAINLVFRHIAMFILPYSTGLLVVSAALPAISISKLILLNLFFVVPITLAGYFLFIKDIEYDPGLKAKFSYRDLFTLLLYASPIYICLIINALTGLPFFIALIFSILAVYLLCDKKQFFHALVKSLNHHTVLMIAAILIMKDLILNLDELILLFTNLINGEIGMLSTLLVFLISSVLFGIITGNQTAPLGIILPMISQLKISPEMVYVYTYFTFACSFAGYFFSPIHLCQAFTLQHMKVETIDLYKEYRLFAPVTFVVAFVSAYLIKYLLV
ncbi:MAG TPA: DUF401 family protein [Sedimentibacter sp.]|nr:DUF401 family protein [Sedimentibacter sp.]HRC80684.1 DUF401 family protein [Sedimentibacter sp.]